MKLQTKNINMIEGTPHHGSDMANFAFKSDSMLSLSADPKTKTSLMTFVAKESDILQMVNESWLHMAQEYKIYSYYETRATVGLRGQTSLVG